jgi:hypothetical protein
MRQQLELRDFAETIRHNRFNKHDFIADTSSMHLTPLGALAVVDGPEIIKYDINSHCHGQIATKLGIPKIYYDRLLRDHTDILSNDITALFRREPERRMVRTIDGVARGYLSDKFRTDMDNYDVAEAALPILEAVPDMQILSLGVTETRMYIKAQFPRLQGAVKVGDIVTGGVVISNSEVGCGALNIEVLIYSLSCTNGMIGQSLVRKFHVGAKQGVSDEAYAVLSQATRDKSAEAMRAIIADVVTAATDESKFQLRLDKLRSTTKEGLNSDVPKAIEVLGNKLNLNKEEQSGVLTRLIEGGDLSRWGVANAVTRAASDIDDYDRATELERAGGKVIELSSRDWTEVSLAAA